MRGLAELTREGYRRDLKLYALPFFRDYRLSDVEPPDARAFVSSMERKGKAPATIRKALAPVRAMCHGGRRPRVIMSGAL